MPRLWKSFRMDRTPKSPDGPVPPEADLSPMEPQPAGAKPPADPPKDSTAETVPGAVWVENGALHVRNPNGLGHWPTVRLAEGSGVELLVNGEARTGEIVLQAEDQVVIQGRIEEQAGQVQVDVAEDGMAAWVTIHAGRRSAFVLSDVPPDLQIELRALRHDESLPHRLSPSDVLEALRAAGVRSSADETAVLQALAAPGTRVLVAEGRQPRSGRSANVWTVIHGQMTAPPEERGDGMLTSAGRASVEIGAPVVWLEPGDAEEPGRTVTGATISAPTSWQPSLVSGPGTVLSADGRTAIAAISGHPVVEFQGDEVFAGVSPELQISGNLDEIHGHVDFDGDIWVGGDVLAERSVCVSGNAEIQGKVIRARIEAGGTIRLHTGAAAALLIAGGPGLTYARALVLCEELASALVRGSTPPPTALAFRIHQELSRADVRLDPEVRALDERLEHFVLHGTKTLEALDAAAGRLGGALGDVLSAAMRRMRQSLERPGRCLVRYLDQTRLEASGDVEIGEAGALRSTVTTLGEVRATGPFRGGSVWALRGARFETVGAGTDLPTRIQIGPRARFVACEVRPGTTVLRGETVLRRFEALALDVVLDPAEKEP